MKRTICFIIIFIFVIIFNAVYAADEVEIKASSYIVQENENIDISLNIGNIKVSAINMWIYFDTEKLEYIEGEENTNFSNGRIIFSWYDKNGGKNPKTNGELGKFKLKSINSGIAKINAIYEAFDEKGKLIADGSSNLNIEILSEKMYTTDKSNSKLQILRLNKEGINPDFNKDINEYYFVTNMKENNIQITAIPENKNSIVNIKGNDNINDGINVIEIEVISEDKKNSNIYKINVTKTNDLEIANANLENLAIEYYELKPFFQTNETVYETQIPSNIEKLNILAVPEKIGNNVQIYGNSNLKEGANTIEIIVTAQNEVTQKKYVINAYKRNKSEEEKIAKDNTNEAEKLSTGEKKQNVNDENEEEIQNTQESKLEKEKKNKKAIAIILIVIAVICSIIIIIKNRRKILKK